MSQRSYGMSRKRKTRGMLTSTISATNRRSVIDKETVTEQGGAGIISAARNLINKGKSFILDDEIGGFDGERHQILQLPNGRFGTANFSGPNTQVLERLKRLDNGDNRYSPRTFVDNTAMRHDIDYMLSGGDPVKVRNADNRMLQTIKRGKRGKRDSRLNFAIAETGIKSKVLGENIGILKKGSFASGDSVSNNDKKTLERHRNNLEQQGFGMPNDGLLPADRLKLQVINQKMEGKGLLLVGQQRTGRRKKRCCMTKPTPKPIKSGRGLKTAGRGLKIAGQQGKGKGISTRGGGLKIAGQQGKGKGISTRGGSRGSSQIGSIIGSGIDLSGFLKGPLIKNILTELKIPHSNIHKPTVNKLVDAVLNKSKNINHIGDFMAESLMALLVTSHLKHKKVPLTNIKKAIDSPQTGNGKVGDFLLNALKKGIISSVKAFINKGSRDRGIKPVFTGSGRKTKSFFRGFAKGFHKVFQIGNKVGQFIPDSILGPEAAPVIKGLKGAFKGIESVSKLFTKL